MGGTQASCLLIPASRGILPKRASFLAASKNRRLRFLTVPVLLFKAAIPFPVHSRDLAGRLFHPNHCPAANGTCPGLPR